MSLNKEGDSRSLYPSGDREYRDLKRKHLARLSLTYLAPLVLVTVYFYVQNSLILEEGLGLHLRAVAEGEASTLDLFLSERRENLSNLLDDLMLVDFPPTASVLNRHLERLRRFSDAFVDLGFIDSRGVQIVYAGPFPSLERRSYSTEDWYRQLIDGSAGFVITDSYLGLRRKPHFTVAVRGAVDGGSVVLKASLEPGSVYEHVTSWGGAEDIFVSVVSREGSRQLVTPGAQAPLGASSVVPPRLPRIGVGQADSKGASFTYAYSWLQTVDWVLMVQQYPEPGRGPLSGLGIRILGIAGIMIVLGVLFVTVGARRLAELQIESDQARAQLTERAKELSCLYGVARLLETPGISMKEILRGTVELVRDAWQYPEITCARIELEGQEFTTENWRNGPWKQSSDIMVSGEKIGVLEVGLTEERPLAEEGPFLKEERDLIRAVTGRLGKNIERRRAEGVQSMLTAAIEDAAESISITDANGTIEYVNPAFLKISGYSREEVVGQNPRILKSGKHDRAFYEDLWKTILGGRTWEGRLTNKRKDGSLYEVDCRISPVRDENGDIVRFVAVKHDITEMVKLETSLRQAQKMEAIGQLAGGVAHDFNNILTVILTNAHYLLKAVDESSPLRQDVEEIKASGERAAALTRQLLAFSRQQVIAPRVLDLNQVLADTEKMLRRLIGEDIELRTVSGSNLGRVYVDPAQIEQVVLNLAVNARDAMPGGGELAIETANVRLNQEYARLHGDVKPGWYVMLSVTDTGTGMSEEIRSRIFEPFFTTKKQGKGTGLGLATVYGIVKQCEGHIWVYSEVGKGTAFKIYFPMVEPKGKTGRMGRLSHRDLEGSETILVVEDDDSVRRTAVRILRDHGYNVLEAGNGKSALEICGRVADPIDLMITDIVMPEMGGRKLADLVSASYPDLKIIYMSGYPKGEPLHQDKLVSPDVFVQKPLIPSELARKAREVLDGK